MAASELCDTGSTVQDIQHFSFESMGRKQASSKQALSQQARSKQALSQQASSKQALSQEARKQASSKLPIKKAKVNGHRWAVFSGDAMKTKFGLTKEDLVKHNGHLLTKKELERSRRQFVNNGLMRWMAATLCAREVLKSKGFVSLKRGTPLYEKTARFYTNPAFGFDDILDILGPIHPCLDPDDPEIIERLQNYNRID